MRLRAQLVPQLSIIGNCLEVIRVGLSSALAMMTLSIKVAGKRVLEERANDDA